MINVRDHGANGDGISLDSEAIQRAINAATMAGGGRVVVPAGTYRCGTLTLASHIDLHLEAGAVIQGSHDLEDYPYQSVPAGGKAKHRHHLIVARGCDDVAITGRGVIDGQGPAFWQPQANERAWIYAKPERVIPMIEIDDCRDVLVDGITLRESPGWTLHLQCCDRARITGVRIDNHRQGPNNDGFDINGCRDVLIAGCHIDTCDDAIVMKTTHNTRSCERITIQNCVLGCNCAAIKCGTESFHDFRQITVTGCIVTRSTRAFALYGFDGGTFEQITVSDMICDTDLAFILNHPIHLDARQRNPDSALSTMRDIRIAGFSALTDGRLLMTAADGCTIDGVRVDGVSMRYALFCDPAPVAPGATSAQGSQHSPDARAARAALVLEGVTNVRVRDVAIAWPEAIDAPGWGQGLIRVENGGDRQFGPADHGDDVVFAALWAKDSSGRIELDGNQASDGTSGTDAAVLINSPDLAVID